MGADYHVVIVNHEIADGSGGQIQLQRLPVIAIVEGDEHGAFGSGEEQALADRDLRGRR